MEKNIIPIEKITIDVNDRFSTRNIIMHDAYDLETNDVVYDLKRCFLMVNKTPEIYMFKDYDSLKEQCVVAYTSENIAKQKLKKIEVGTKMVDKKIKKINAWDIFMENIGLFIVDGLKFYSEDPNLFSYFRGYDYKVLDSVNEEVISLFLDHIRNVIANGNDEIYNYILVWVASILQKPSFKTGIALVILGKQGAGKNDFFTNVICHLMSRYANENITSIDSIIGTFNAALENKKLLVLNELQSIDVNKYLNSDKLKSVITDRTLNINQKNEHEREAENVANLIMVSNNNIPIKIESCDRRYCVTKASDIHIGDYEYFEKLFESFTPEFYENLFTFFMKMDVSKINLRKIPNSESKEIIKEDSMSSYEIFAREKYAQINDITGPELFNLYNDFIEKNKFSQCSSRTFSSNIKQFTGEAKSKRISGKVCRIYSLLPEVKEKYKKYHDDLVASIVNKEEEEDDDDDMKEILK